MIFALPCHTTRRVVKQNVKFDNLEFRVVKGTNSTAAAAAKKLSRLSKRYTLVKKVNYNVEIALKKILKCNSNLYSYNKRLREFKIIILSKIISFSGAYWHN